MSQQIEKEFKNLLTKKEYERLRDSFQLEQFEPIQQTNVYFDTDKMDLKNQQMGLRIRLYSDSAELTLKSPIQENEKLETTDLLSLSEAEKMVAEGKITLDGMVKAKLAEVGISLEELGSLGQLSTVRYEFTGEGGTYFLDESYYQDQKDYEIEFETEDLVKGRKIFEDFLHTYQIKKRKTAQKIERMLQYPNQ